MGVERGLMLAWLTVNRERSTVNWIVK